MYAMSSIAILVAALLVALTTMVRRKQAERLTRKSATRERLVASDLVPNGYKTLVCMNKPPGRGYAYEKVPITTRSI